MTGILSAYFLVGIQMPSETFNYIYKLVYMGEMESLLVNEKTAQCVKLGETLIF